MKSRRDFEEIFAVLLQGGGADVGNAGPRLGPDTDHDRLPGRGAIVIDGVSDTDEKGRTRAITTTPLQGPHCRPARREFIRGVPAVWPASRGR